MTSHYFSCTIEEPFETLFQALSKTFGNIYFQRFGKNKEPHLGVILGEEYFLRVNSDVAVLILLKELSSGETELEVISCAGGTGLSSFSAHAHSAYIQNVKKFLKDSHFKVESEKEITYYSSHSSKVAEYENKEHCRERKG